MPRSPTARPPGEHLAVLARIVRQVDASETMNRERKRAIQEHLAKAMAELQKEIVKK
jgi:hypothetical protein